MRLFKYRKQNFEVFWESFDRSRVDMDYFKELREDRDLHPKNVKGLGRLILAEMVVSGRRPYTDYLTSRALKKLGDAQDPEFTGPTVYTRLEIPYTKRFTADRVRQFVARHSSIPFLFGTLNEILKGSGSAKPEEKELPGRLGFMKDNPGRQMIGSFYPLDEQGWAEAAYEVMDHLSDCEELSSGSEGTEYRRSEEEDSEEEDSEEEEIEKKDSEEEDSEEEDSEEEDSEEQEIEEEDSEEEDSEKQDSKGPENREATDSSVVEHSNNTDVHRREQ
ncbi:retrotransposon-like protein 1 [Aspergillus niger]|nr:retrotransposon-like protein 1 [Aspergillus niger]